MILLYDTTMKLFTDSRLHATDRNWPKSAIRLAGLLWFSTDSSDSRVFCLNAPNTRHAAPATY